VKKLVIIESPYQGEVSLNIEYACRCIRDSLSRGEAPIASHILYAQSGILDDCEPDERQAGIEAGLAWYRVADLCVVYADRGISRGMSNGIERATWFGRPVEVRMIEREVAA
jgi:hypothetical protein